MRSIAVVHGCCKAGNPARNTEALVVQEGVDAVAQLGSNPPIQEFPYYTCLLARIGRSEGHDLALPADCPDEGAGLATIDERDLEAWMEELNAEIQQGPQPLGPWPSSRFRDAHVYLHHDGVRTKVWDKVKDDIDRSIDPDAEYVLVAHSLGSIVTADMIREGVIGPSAFVTVGSPLGLKLVARSVSSFQATIPWVNIYDPEDIVSGVFGNQTPDDRGFGGTPYSNVIVDNLPPSQHDIIGYLSTPGARDAINSLLEG